MTLPTLFSKLGSHSIRDVLLATCAIAPLQFDSHASPRNAVEMAAPTTQVVASSIAAGIDADRPFASYAWQWSLECAGQVRGATKVPDEGIFGNVTGSAAPVLKFGRVADPLAPARRVLSFIADRNDPRIAGAPRCEVIISPTQSGRLQVGQEFWSGFGVLLPGWQATGDEQIIYQWHAGDGSTPLNPFLAISVQGDSFRIQARYSAITPANKQNTIKSLDVQSPGLPTARWTYFVLHAKVSHDGASQPYLQVWRDGRPIINQAGPLGYSLLTGRPYAKFGHYHWIDESNPWPVDVPTRTVLLRSPVFIVEGAATYSADDVLGYVMRH